ncbi:MFS transporter [Pseudomonas sp.]|uniref:MFS transporter n=1 Tax=Pseudomonas sp. TaxID=306 RepID=UPI002631D19C|nr:MFS transporter [Pseudomonas sp.]
MTNHPVIPGSTYRQGGGHAWWIWAIATVFVLYVFGVQTIFAIVQPSIRADLQLSLTQIALVGSVYTWAFAFFQFFSGPILDSFGARKALIPAVALSVLGVWLYATSQDITMLLLAQLVMALGAVFGFVGAGYIGGMWFGMASFGVMFGYVETTSSIASAFEQQLTTLALKYVSWRELLSWVGGAGIVLWVFTLIWVRNPAPIPKSTTPIVTKVTSGLVTFLKMPQGWLVGIWGGITFGINLAVGVIWAPVIMTGKGFDSDLSNWAASLVWLGLGIGSLFWPRWSNWARSRKKPALIGIAIQAATLAAIILLPGSFPVWVFFLLWLANGISSANEMIAFQSAADMVQPSQAGSSASFINGLMFIIGGVLMNVPAHLLGADEKFDVVAYLPYVGVLVLAFLIASIQRETFPKASPEKV